MMNSIIVVMNFFIIFPLLTFLKTVSIVTLGLILDKRVVFFAPKIKGFRLFTLIFIKIFPTFFLLAHTLHYN